MDGQSIEDFEKDLRNNLYKIWNRMSPATYFPPAVKAVEIPKPHGGGTRIPAWAPEDPLVDREKALSSGTSRMV